MRLVRNPITIVNKMTTIGSVARIRAVSALGSMYAEMYSGNAMNSCQKTIQYPVKISKKQHEPRIREHGKEVFSDLTETCRFAFTGAARLFEEQQHEEEHERIRSRLRCEIHFPRCRAVAPRKRVDGPDGAADVYQRVVNRISDGADIFF